MDKRLLVKVLEGKEETDVKKAMKFADQLIKKAEQERDKKGYRENLGYDSERKLKDFISKLDLTYSDKSKVLDYFIGKCDKI